MWSFTLSVLLRLFACCATPWDYCCCCLAIYMILFLLYSSCLIKCVHELCSSLDDLLLSVFFCFLFHLKIYKWPAKLLAQQHTQPYKLFHFELLLWNQSQMEKPAAAFFTLIFCLYLDSASIQYFDHLFPTNNWILSFLTHHPVCISIDLQHVFLRARAIMFSVCSSDCFE